VKAADTRTGQERATASILLVEDDDLLVAHAADLGFPDLAVQAIGTVAEAELHVRRGEHDIIVLSLDVPAAFDTLEKICAMPGAPPVIAIAAKGRCGLTLEHILTVAELHGAVLSLPKPIDASELALAAVRALEKRRGEDNRLVALAGELEKLALY
jgi:DNA-binding response OmpR family regulator